MSDESRAIFYCGVDVGQKVDHSAVCLVERTSNKAIVRLLVKYQLGVAYPLLVSTVSDMVSSVKQMGDIYGFTVDATGIGASPAQMFQEALPDIQVESFIFTNKTKRELIGKVKVLHSFGRLKFATRRGDEIYNRTLQELMTEMKQLQVKVIREGDVSPEIEVFRTGTHDDLFTALALAVKDIEFEDSSGVNVNFIQDKTWVETPLSDVSQEPPVILF